MSLEYEDCVKRGKIKKFTRGKSLIQKKLADAKNDLEAAKNSVKDKGYKWGT